MKIFRKNRSVFAIPWKIKVTYFFASRKWLRRIWYFIIFPLIVLVAPAIVGIYLYIQFLSGKDIFSNPSFTGLFGALFGAVLGAIIAGITSSIIQSQQFQVEMAINKKREVYTPLYEKIIEIKEELEENRYPIQTRMEGENTVPDIAPDFSGWWESIKRKSIFIQIPKWIVKILGTYGVELEQYECLYKKAAEDVGRVVEKEFSPHIGLDENLLTKSNWLRGVLFEKSHKEDPWQELYDRVQLGDEDKSHLHSNIIEQCESLPSVKKLKSFWESIIQHTDWLIQELRKIIRYIEVRYENQSELF